MRPAACDLRALPFAQVVGEQTALRLDNEVQPLGAVLLDEHRPVRIVGAQRSWHFKPTGELGIDFDRIVLLQLVGEGRLGAGVVDDLLVNRFSRVEHVLQVAGQFFLLE